MKFGARSKALRQAHPDLFDETLGADLAECERQLAELKGDSTPSDTTPILQEEQKRPRAGRQAFPAHLPRSEVRHEPESTQCSECGGEMRGGPS